MNIVKSLVMMSALSVYAHQIQSTFIITNDAKLGTIIGFSDSSFNYGQADTKRARYFCYVGDIDEVCAQIEQAAFDMNNRYYQGGHDRIELLSCEIQRNGDSFEYDYSEVYVETTYNLNDDYGSDFTVTRKIEACLTN